MLVGKVEENAARPLVSGLAREPPATLGILFGGSGRHGSPVKA
jgi:hypothetical protein